MISVDYVKIPEDILLLKQLIWIGPEVYIKSRTFLTTHNINTIMSSKDIVGKQFFAQYYQSSDSAFSAVIIKNATKDGQRVYIVNDGTKLIQDIIHMVKSGLLCK